MAVLGSVMGQIQTEKCIHCGGLMQPLSARLTGDTVILTYECSGCAKLESVSTTRDEVKKNPKPQNRAG